MDPIIVGVVATGVLLVLLVFGMPIAFASLVIGFSGLVVLSGWGAAFSAVGYLPHPLVSAYGLTVIPLFILMGYLAFYGGLTENLFAAARAWVGHMPGGLAIAAALGSAGFAACSGSSLASAAVMGKTAIPEMRKYGYDNKLATGVIAASGTLAALIPPSGLMVLYGFLTEQSIGAMLIAGFLPGIVSVLIYALLIYFRCRINPSIAPTLALMPLKQRLFALRETWVVVVVIFLILGGIYSGVFTPTEAGAAAAFIVFIFALARRRLSWSAFKESLLTTGRTTCMIFLVIMGILIFMTFLAFTGVPKAALEFMVSLPVPSLVLLIGCLSVYLILGMFLDPIGMMALTLPIVYPLILHLGYNPIWFGVLVIKMSEIALITPPVGLNVYIVRDVVKDVPLEEIFRGVWPFVAMDILTVAVLIAFPQIALFLPNMMKRG